MSSVAENVSPRHRLTVENFHRMGEAGIFGEDDRLELIDGEIIDRAPIGSRHAGSVFQLAELVRTTVGSSGFVWVQNPVRLGEYSEPQPDIALLRPRADFYKSAHPRPEDVLLLIEVADATLTYDRDVKVPLYARHGIPEVWLVDLENKRLHLFTSPSQEGYRECHILAEPGVFAPDALPNCPVDLSGLFL